MADGRLDNSFGYKRYATHNIGFNKLQQYVFILLTYLPKKKTICFVCNDKFSAIKCKWISLTLSFDRQQTCICFVHRLGVIEFDCSWISREKKYGWEIWCSAKIEAGLVAILIVSVCHLP